MDVLQHAAHGFLMGYAPTGKVSWGLAGALIGAEPDITGAMGRLMTGGFWDVHIEVHKVKLSNFRVFSPPALLHIWLDSFTHEWGQRWWVWNERLWVEVVGWIITAIAGYFLIFGA
jgi:hypothetical protein